MQSTSARKKISSNSAVRIAITMAGAKNFLADGGIDAQFLAKFARQRLGGRFAGLDFAAGKFPLQCVRIVAPPLANQKF